MKTYEVVIEGVAPGLLMHKFGAEAELSVGPGGVRKSKATKPTPTEEAEQGAYRLESGDLCQPAEHVYQALCKAATEFQVKGRGKKTYKDAVKGNVLIEPEYIPHGQAEYLIDARPVRIQRARIMRHRAWLKTWQLGFQLQVIDEDMLPEDVLAGILQKAGQAIGVGDYRPRFGRFVVRKFLPTQTS